MEEGTDGQAIMEAYGFLIINNTVVLDGLSSFQMESIDIIIRMVIFENPRLSHLVWIR